MIVRDLVRYKMLEVDSRTMYSKIYGVNRGIISAGKLLLIIKVSHDLHTYNKQFYFILLEAPTLY